MWVVCTAISFPPKTQARYRLYTRPERSFYNRVPKGTPLCNPVRFYEPGRDCAPTPRQRLTEREKIPRPVRRFLMRKFAVLGGGKPQPPKFPECTNFALDNLYVRPPLSGLQRNSCLERRITARNVSHSWYG